MNQNICPVCGDEALVDLNGAFETQYIDRRGVRRALSVPNISRLHCESCHEEIFEDEATRQIENARRTAMGLLSAEQIRELRLSLGKTQVEMSGLLGVGAKTYCRWESGSFTQSQSFDNYLRLIRDVPEACLMLIRMHDHGIVDAPFLNVGEETNFEFLTDAESLGEQAARFTEQLLRGTLHVCV